MGPPSSHTLSDNGSHNLSRREFKVEVSQVMEIKKGEEGGRKKSSMGEPT